MLGLHDDGGVGGGDVVDENRTNNAINGETGGGGGRRGMNENSGGGGKRTTTTLAEEMMIDTEAAVMANFEFLASEVRFFNLLSTNYLMISYTVQHEFRFLNFNFRFYDAELLISSN